MGNVIVAGVGNVLRGDDGFGVVVAQRLLSEGVPRGVTVMDVGIGGIHLVQELIAGASALVVVDAVDLGRSPGSVLTIKPEVRDVMRMSVQERHDELADMHYATPERAFMLAGALGVLPPEAWIVGCQPLDTERFSEGLSAPVTAAVEVAVGEVRRLVTAFGTTWNPSADRPADPSI